MDKIKKEMRIAQLKAMHEVMIHSNDERIYMIWVRNAVPDCPSEDDFEFIAENDDSYNETCDSFARLVSKKIFRY